MGSRQKGAAFERRIKNYLRSIGFIGGRPRELRGYVPGRGPILGDFLDCDLVMVHNERPYTLFIQAHAGTSPGPRMAKLEAIAWNPAAQRVQLWLVMGGVRSGIKVMTLEGGKTWVERLFKVKEGQWPADREILG